MKVEIKCQRMTVLEGAMTLPKGVIYIDEKDQLMLAQNATDLCAKYPNDIEIYKGELEGKDVMGSRAKSEAKAPAPVEPAKAKAPDPIEPAKAKKSRSEV